MDIRNIAIIAHVDHGKTTLTDAILKQAGLVTEETSMDSDSIEQERGITIYAKNASFFYKNSKINIIDTPGHADFSSEVERVLRSIDSVLLLVDAQEGPMPQTKFVLKKSLELGLEPIVVINKVDKPAARPEMVLEMVYELFLDLGASDKQLDFSVVYAVSKTGQAGLDSKNLAPNLEPLLDMIISKVPVASREVNDALLLAQPFNLAYDNFLGRLAICRIYEGRLKSGQSVFIKDKNGVSRSGKITKLFTWQGLSR
ncbi:MAG: GTP-binding protein, partial [Patescibacteria group bacterium]|nr:GTP-binding protein [Patescibacteria group bacterium]